LEYLKSVLSIVPQCSNKRLSFFNSIGNPIAN
jgi:hypothetical protein